MEPARSASLGCAPGRVGGPSGERPLSDEPSTWPSVSTLWTLPGRFTPLLPKCARKCFGRLRVQESLSTWTPEPWTRSTRRCDTDDTISVLVVGRLSSIASEPASTGQLAKPMLAPLTGRRQARPIPIRICPPVTAILRYHDSPRSHPGTGPRYGSRQPSRVRYAALSRTGHIVYR